MGGKDIVWDASAEIMCGIKIQVDIYGGIIREGKDCIIELLVCCFIIRSYYVTSKGIQSLRAKVSLSNTKPFDSSPAPDIIYKSNKLPAYSSSSQTIKAKNPAPTTHIPGLQQSLIHNNPFRGHIFRSIEFPNKNTSVWWRRSRRHFHPGPAIKLTILMVNTKLATLRRLNETPL